MPREHKKRGRREQKKRKREEEEEEGLVIYDEPPKRQRTTGAEEEVEIVVDGDTAGQGYGYGYDDSAPYSGPGDLPFYGLLDEQEQEYFKRADSLLELNQFADQAERELFLANVWKEAGGKELKIANSQSCSRLLERLILLSTPKQLKMLFRKFSGQ